MGGIGVPRTGISFSIRCSSSLKPKSAAAFLASGLDEFHLAEQGTDDQDRRHAADLIGDMSPAPALLAFDIENLLGQLFPAHGRDLDF